MKTKKLASALSLFFTLVFFVQTSAWAMGTAISSDTQILIKETIHQYNSLTDNQRKEEFFKIIATRSKADQEFIKKNLGKNLIFPEIKVENDTLSFKYQNTEHTLVVKSKHLVMVDGQEIDLGPGKFEAAVFQLEKVLNKKKTGLLDHLIPSAYAEPIIIVTALVAIVAWIAYIATLVYRVAKDEKILKNACRELQKKADKLKVNSSQDDIRDLQITVSRELGNLKRSCKNCAAGIQCRLCDSAISCIEELVTELKSHPNAINSSGREDVTDPARDSSRDKKESIKSGQQ